MIVKRYFGLINVEDTMVKVMQTDPFQGQLSAARAAQLAAQRTELPVLAQVVDLQQGGISDKFLSEVVG